MEIGGERLASPFIVHEVLRELICPDSCLLVLGLMIVDHELSASIAVEIDHAYVVCAKDE